MVINKIQFAPVNVPIHRRKQTLAILIWLTLPFICLLIYATLLYFTRYTRALAILYLVWIIWIDKSPSQGGRPSHYVRQFPLWTWMRDFFPVILIKESELDPTGNYVFGFHPHAIFGLSAMINFGTESNNVSQLFPGIHLRLATLTNNFKIPIYRELLLWLGFASVDRDSCTCILNQGPGHSICIVVGGAQESLYAQPGCLDLVLNKRLGFIKIAIKNNASLVPVLSIGENEVYNLFATTKGTFLYKAQQVWKTTFGFSIPLFFGRGIFNYTFGLMPYRRKIVTIVLAPLHPHKIIGKHIDPDRLCADELDTVCKQVHAAYVQVLTSAWDKYKDQYAPNRIKELQIVE